MFMDFSIILEKVRDVWQQHEKPLKSNKFFYLVIIWRALIKEEIISEPWKLSKKARLRFCWQRHFIIITTKPFHVLLNWYNFQGECQTKLLYFVISLFPFRDKRHFPLHFINLPIRRIQLNKALYALLLLFRHLLETFHIFIAELLKHKLLIILMAMSWLISVN